MRTASHLLWVLMIALVVGLSLVPHLITTPNESDKVLHVLAYSFLMVIPVVLLPSLRAHLITGFVLMLMGVLNEVLQDIIGGRQASVRDALANCVGVVLGIGLGRLFKSGLEAHPRRMGVSGFFLALLSLSPSLALAQPTSPDNVLALPPSNKISDQSTIGIPLGGFMVSPGVKVETNIHDNIFLSKNDTSADMVTVVEPALAVQTNWNRHSLYFGTKAEKASYKRYSHKDYTDYGFLLSGQYDIAYETYVVGGLERNRKHYGRGAGEDQEGGDTVDYNATKGSLSFTRALSYLQLKLFGSTEKSELESDRFLLGSGDYFEKTSNTYQSNISFEYLPENELFLEVTYNTTDYSLINGSENQAKRLNTRLGLKFDTASLYRGSLFGGYLHREHEGEFDVKDPYVGGSFVWAITPLTAFSLQSARYFSEPSVSGTGGSMTTSHQAELRSSLTTRLSGATSLRYDDNDYSLSGTSQKNKLLEAGVEANYRLSDNLSADAEYNYRRRISTVSSEDYTDNHVLFSLTYMH